MADAPEDDDRELTFAELIKLPESADSGRGAVSEPEPEPTEEAPRAARPRARDDELLTDLPASDYHLGPLGGWRATRKVRWFVGGTLGLTALVGAVLLIVHMLDVRHRALHPLAEVEATITDDTPREMTLSDGSMRVGLGREPPAVNIVHLPDRDITLARGSSKAQFKVEVRDGKTARLQVLTGEIVETLTDPSATALLE
jgi:hypothetical protein